MLDYEFNTTTPANDFVNAASLTLPVAAGGAVGINLFAEGTNNPFTALGTYHLLGYGGTEANLFNFTAGDSGFSTS